jgi:hypothetical protein
MSQDKIEKLKLYCTERLAIESGLKEAVANYTGSDEAKEQYMHDICVRIVEIEGFLLLLNMENPVWGDRL